MTMTKSEALAKIFETYSDTELLIAKDEPETDITAGFGEATNVVDLFDDGRYAAYATRERVRQAFRNAGHGVTAADAIVNARRILKQDATR
jgi:hypothetical protein